VVSWFSDAVADFHHKHGIKLGDYGDPWPNDWRLRLSLIGEEFNELADALVALDDTYGVGMGVDSRLADVAKELTDLLYVVVGTFEAWGLDMEACFGEVHASNMSKQPGAKRGDGKVLKGEGYKPADMVKVLRNQVLMWGLKTDPETGVVE
jgi:NTP pyrophosphatase (non-canonical NTP hydrolase)